MTLLTKEQIVAAKDLKHEMITVKEWGGDVQIRELTGVERDELESFVVEHREKNDPKGFRAKLLSMSVVDVADKPLFTPTELNVKSGKVLARLFMVAQRLSGLGVEAETEIRKN